VIEIVKRELAAQGGKWFQYTVVEGRKQEVVRNGKHRDDGKRRRREQVEERDGEEGLEGEEGEEEGEVFEMMKTPFERALEGQPKIREVPMLMVYLSRVRIDVLRKKYGYVYLSNHFGVCFVLTT